MQHTFFYQVILHMVLLWNHLLPFIDVCSKVMIIIAKVAYKIIQVVSAIATAQKLYTWYKHPELAPGFYKLQRAEQQVRPLWTRIIHSLRKYLGK